MRSSSPLRDERPAARSYIGGMLKHIDFLASNVPGIRMPLYPTGAKVDSFYGFGHTIGAALNVTLMSYCGTCCVCPAPRPRVDGF